MSKMNEMPPAFLAPEWVLRGQRDYGYPEGIRLRAHRVMAETQKLVDQTNKATERMQEDVNKKLAQRIQDVRMWRGELYRKLEEMVEEIEALQMLGTRLERAIESCSEALTITLLCLAERQKYVGASPDRVESELMKERELIERVISLLHCTLKQTNEQTRLNRSATYFLERDLQDNFQAEQIDSFCCILTKPPPNVVYAEEPDLTTPGVSSEDWNTITNMKVSKLEQQRRNSISLRAQAQSTLERTATDLRRQHQATGGAIEENTQDNRKAKEEMEESLAKVLADTESVDNNMASLGESIEAKQGQLSVAQVQLAARSQRPGIEQCQDAAQVQLLAMVQELSAYISGLSESLSLVEVELRSLNRSQVFLEEQIQIRANALKNNEATYGLLQQKANCHSF
ncbi:tektin-1-like [Anguilla rostrata]|uniref:tektin-1-like n=1 Tax=Anguilla rostrata TaxID=7938 RepID=UPI0030CF75DE